MKRSNGLQPGRLPAATIGFDGALVLDTGHHRSMLFDTKLGYFQVKIDYSLQTDDDRNKGQFPSKHFAGFVPTA
jgi:hypothetical protein